MSCCARGNRGVGRCAGKGWVRSALLTCVLVADVSALTVPPATGQSPPPQLGPLTYTITDDMRMMLKYLEGIPTEGDINGQRPSFEASYAKRLEQSAWGYPPK